MPAIVAKTSRAIDPTPLRELAKLKLNQEYQRPLNWFKTFQTKRFCSTGQHEFHLCQGGREAAHRDWSCYLGIVILEPNGWVLKSPRQRARTVYQEAGDLVILKRDYRHHVVWDRHCPKPTQPWLYLLIDFYSSTHWACRSITPEIAHERAQEALTQLKEAAHWSWLTSGLQIPDFKY